MKHAARYECMEEPTCEDVDCIFWTICNKYRDQLRLEAFNAYIENLDEEHARIVTARGM